VAIAERFGDVNAAYRFRAVQIGNRAGDFQHPCIAPRRQGQLGRSVRQERCTSGIGGGELVNGAERHVGIDEAAAFRAAVEPAGLKLPGAGNPFADFSGSLRGRRKAEIDCGDRRRLVEEIDPVHERAGYRFFRVEANFEVKATGERIRFDYIAWCGGSVTHWRARSPSIRYNLYPEMMHIPTQDGAAIGIRTFNMCDHWTWENEREGKSRIPDDLLPVVQWYPDVNDMGFAIGYESDAAYESPYSKLNFLSAKLSQTDAETWASWRKAYEAGFKPVGNTESPYYDINTPSRIRRVCNSASRVAIPSERMQEAERLMPVETGRFWFGATSRMTEARKQSAEAFEKLLNLDAWRYGRHFQGQNLSAFRKGGS